MKLRRVLVNHGTKFECGGNSVEETERVSRRQFLTYTLMGVGGFMVAGISTPMIRAAIDPVLKQKVNSDMVAVTQTKDITNQPQKKDFKISQTDAWYTSEVTQTAWIYQDESGKFIALSPICKHLGCTVNWNGDPSNNEKFYCPCHGGLYTKDGTNVKGTPPLAPLDRYELEVKEGTIYLGKTKGGA